MSPDDLIYHGGALGDFLTVWPALEVRRDLDPGRNTVWLGRAVHGQLAAAAGLVDACWDIEDSGWTAVFSDEPLNRERNPFNGIRSALIFAKSPSPIVAHLKAAGCREIVRLDPFPASRVSAVEHHLRLFRHEPPESEFYPRLKSLVRGPLSEDLEIVRGSVLIHPGSGSPRKNWPLERFIEVAEWLHGRGHRACWIQGPAEPRIGAEPVLAGLALDTLARVLARGRCYLGNDSGVSHLAAAAGCPVIALFGPSDPVIWAPPGPSVTVLWAGGPWSASSGTYKPAAMEDISVKQVLECLASRLTNSQSDAHI